MTTNPQPLRWWQKLALTGGGVVAAVLLVFSAAALLPNKTPTQGERTDANTARTVEFYTLDGDEFAWIQGKVRPPKENVLLTRFSIAWDADGFRLPNTPFEQYPIAVVGDSFTEGANVAQPYADGIAQRLGVGVYNYGYRAYGPNEMRQVALEFFPQESRSWILYAHFSGNDLYQAQLSPEEWIQSRSSGLLLPFLERAVGNIQQSITEADPNAHYDYPMPVVVGGNYYELVLLDEYLWWQRAPVTGFANTRPLRVIDKVLADINEVMPATTCRAVIFIPTASQLYYPYLVDGRQWLRPLAKRATVTDAEGTLKLEPAPYTEAEEAAFLATLGDQRDALRELATRQGWLFIDLLQPFQEAIAATSGLYYYPYDTHWDQSGHDLAAEIIADYLRDHAEDCPLTIP